jgi:hypothetical protein
MALPDQGPDLHLDYGSGYRQNWTEINPLVTIKCSMLHTVLRKYCTSTKDMTLVRNPLCKNSTPKNGLTVLRRRSASVDP